ncbi:hypothetical protein CAPTEDRAFT_166167 [Capitella teleta]|uniref:3-beta hydroxysteroid dehydrogenase/isomerase domain-containing protein n=1 Tax=Capitella teleta TaxID=283909 RepID=R7UTV9_CAPTE|nr:hypothetical protein CAPTEDRAFT_166167 [Capitella teleta]|eukprot:ELU09595.1 hypothetical protein CAPTEDRAFT_166167 [Capitella teleta]
MVELRSSSSTLSDDQNTERHLVTGGGGYVGLRLGAALLDKGHKVTLFDLNPPNDEEIPAGAQFIQGDIREYDDVLRAFEIKVDCVYHLASYGMSGREQLNKKLIEEVNVQGTRNVIRACKERGVARLVYTSTYNVVFGGQTIINGDESLPYLPLDKHPDNYSRTKSIAEVIVLDANGSAADIGQGDGVILRTCALRLAGVYGPGEKRHLPRIVKTIKSGMFCFVYGGDDCLVDFLHVDNLVQGHVLAAEALGPRNKHVAAGQAYFLSDDKPVNNFEFFRPLFEGLGHKFPTLKLPISLIYFIAFVVEIIHGILGRVYNFQPLLTRTEVYKTGVTHYFSIAKAARDFGYKPTVQNDLEACVDWFKVNGHLEKKVRRKQSLIVDLILAFTFAAFLLSFLPFVM